MSQCEFTSASEPTQPENAAPYWKSPHSIRRARKSKNSLTAQRPKKCFLQGSVCVILAGMFIPLLRNQNLHAGSPFRIRLACIVCCPVLLVSVAGLRSVAQSPASGEEAALAALEKLGGKVSRDSSQPKNPVVEVVLMRTAATDRDLAPLEGFKQLQRLNLGLTRVTDAGMAHLRGLESLEELDLSVTKITDKGLEVIKGLTGLRRLFIARGTITGSGLAAAKDLPHLQELRLPNTGLTDEGMAGLKELKHLQVLYLSHNAITDAGVAQLRSLTELVELRLSGTGISDPGLAGLKGLINLKLLELAQTRVSEAAVKALQSAIPGLQVAR